MNLLGRGTLILLLSALSTGCVVQTAITLVPGAAEVEITTNVADITGCPAVGYIPAADIDSLIDRRVAQNEAVALNANIVYDTGYGGVAYRCNK